MGASHSKKYTLDSSSNLDTVALAKKVRDKQGTWETEISFRGEDDLERHLTVCDKNPGHQNFIPVHKFTLADLPTEYRQPVIAEWVRAVSDLTVRVSVSCVSDRRPEFFPGSDIPYPCYRDTCSKSAMALSAACSSPRFQKVPENSLNNCRPRPCLSTKASNILRVGSGVLSDVVIFPSEGYPDETCDCRECRNSPLPLRQFARIHIDTATHVVFDQSEAEMTSCHFFFDRGKRPDTSQEVVTLCGLSCNESDILTDRCKMRFVTHDIALASRLHLIRTHAQELTEQVRQFVEKADDSKEDQRLTLIVSHPHGSSKQISVGYCRGGYMGRGCLYTTPTCPGSSGAPVIGIQNKKPLSDGGGFHSGNCERDRNLNFSYHKFYNFLWF